MGKGIKPVGSSLKVVKASPSNPVGKGKATTSTKKAEPTREKEGAALNFSPPNLRKKTSVNPQDGGSIKDQ